MYKDDQIGKTDEQTESMYDICLLHSRADRALRTILTRQLDQFDLTMMEWLMLETVKQAPREGLTMSTVAATLDVTLPQVTALSTSLGKAKLVKQQVSRQDRRSRRLNLTASGKKLLADAENAARQALDTWTRDISDEQQAAYQKTLKVLASLNNKH